MTALVVTASPEGALAEEVLSVIGASGSTYVSKLSKIESVQMSFSADPAVTATTNYVSWSGRTVTFNGSSTARCELIIKGRL